MSAAFRFLQLQVSLMEIEKARFSGSRFLLGRGTGALLLFFEEQDFTHGII